MNTTDEMRRDLLAGWLTLLQPFGVGEPAAHEAFTDLAARYAEPTRFYHNLDHLADVLATVGRLREHAANFPAVRLAAWFHDAVYDTRAADNEERSSDLAAEVLTRLALPAAVIGRVRPLILLTKAHRATADDRDGHVLLDADLAILGSPPDRYATCSAAIRREYAWVPEEQYRAGRARVLQGFLRRERLYFLDEMHAALEARARENLAAEVAALS